MKNVIFIYASLIMILGCASYNYRNDPDNLQLQQLLGKSIEQVGMRLGAPTSQHRLGALEILIYAKNCSQTTTSYEGFWNNYEVTGQPDCEEVIKCYFPNNKMSKYEIYWNNGTIVKVENNNGVIQGLVEYYEDVLDSWSDNTERNKDIPAKSNEIIKHTRNAVIADIPIGVRNEVLKEISMDDLKGIIRDMDKDAARRLTAASIRAIYNFNQGMRKK